jgi:hypothetical protein
MKTSVRTFDYLPHSIQTSHVSFPYICKVYVLYSTSVFTTGLPFSMEYVNFTVLSQRGCAHKLLYVSSTKYIKKRLERIEKSDIIRPPPFYNDIFYWDLFRTSKNDHLGHFFLMKRVRLLLEKHQSLLFLRFKFLYL